MMGVMRSCFLIVALFVAVLAPGSGVRAADPVAETVIIPFQGYKMAVQVFKPDGAGPFPVLVFSHGRSGKPDERASMKVTIPIGHVVFWQKRGFAVVAPFRPGYGPTGGADRENSGSKLDSKNKCTGKPDYATPIANAREAVQSTIDWVRKQGWAKTDRILLEGVSVGGLTTIAVAATNPQGVVGAINFSGGEAGYVDKNPGHSCFPELLTTLYGQYGRTARIPTLWLYAENDQFWGAEAPTLWHKAFAAGGSNTKFVMTAPVPDHDGHFLMNYGGHLWADHVNPFIKTLGF